MTISIDSNILLPAIENQNPLHGRASEFVGEMHRRNDVVVSELMLVELYGLLRNPTVLPRQMSPAEAVAAIESFRNHPRWQVVSLPAGTRGLHDDLSVRLAERDFARRRVYDLRLALSLVQQGVAEFATANLRDFQDVGFRRVWNPLVEA